MGYKISYQMNNISHKPIKHEVVSCKPGLIASILAIVLAYFALCTIQCEIFRYIAAGV